MSGINLGAMDTMQSPVKLLFVGDVHATAAELRDCQSLLKLILKFEHQEQPSAVVFLGDNYNNHSTVNLEVVDFWKHAVKAIRSPIVWILGNHETTGVRGSSINALQIHKGDRPDLLLVDRPTSWSGFLLMPYMDDPQDFVTAARSFSDKRLICHQTFQGAQYENGFYAPDGVDQEKIPQVEVISGHIHRPGSVGKVTYIGSPRWRTISDANVDRHLWSVTYGDGQRMESVLHGTAGFCEPIYHLEDRPEAPVDLNVVRGRIHVDIYGPPEYVGRRQSELSMAGVRVRTFPDRKAAHRVRESDGVGKAFRQFVADFKPEEGVDLQAFLQLIDERNSWLMKK